jgi:hypothetical protein
MGFVLLIMTVLLGLAVTGGLTIYAVVRRGISWLMGWARQNRIAEMIPDLPLLDAARSSQVVRQVTGTPEYRYLNPETATPRQIVAIVRPMRGDAMLSPYAHVILGAVGKVGFYRDGFDQVLDHEFGRGSLTFARYDAPVQETLREVVATASRMANRMQMFDSAEYGRLSGRGADVGSAESEQLHVMMESQASLDAMKDSILRMMAGLERLHGELSQLSVSHARGECETLLEEMSRLASDARLYR